jgi:hypothetical protein
MMPGTIGVDAAGIHNGHKRCSAKRCQAARDESRRRSWQRCKAALPSLWCQNTLCSRNGAPTMRLGKKHDGP